MPQALIDTGASLNICPLTTLKMLEIPESVLRPTSLMIEAYDNSQRPVHGIIVMYLEFGPTTTPVEFHVMNIDASFNLILGRRWIKQMRAVPSTFHQCIQFPYKGKVYRVFGDEPFEGQKIDSCPCPPTIKAFTSILESSHQGESKKHEESGPNPLIIRFVCEGERE